MRVILGKYPGLRSKKERKVSVRIDPWDTWNLDRTLSLIILPCLRQLRDEKHGAPFVDDEDVPEELRSTSAPPRENEWDTDDNHFKRWDWVLDEMVWAFENVAADDWEDQFHSGECDFQHVPVKVGDETLYEMVRGPGHTHSFDKEGYDAYLARIKRGLALFGKYYLALWD